MPVKPPLLPSTTPVRSAADSFIDVTAKLSMAMAALAIAWSLLQLLVVALLGQLDIPARMWSAGLPVPDWVVWANRYALALTTVMLLLSIGLLTVSWALLKRREWGRLGFIVFLVVVALGNFASLPLVDSMFSGMQAMFPAEMLDSPQGAELRAQLQVGRWTSMLSAVVTSLAFAGLHGWLVVKLQRRDVRALFH